MSQSAPTEVMWFSHINKTHLAQVGGKGANLGEMVQAGFPVPNGFVVTAQAYFRFIKDNDLEKTIRAILEPLDVNNSQALQKAALKVQQLILKAKMPADLASQIVTAYHKLGKDVAVAVRSSATAEDLPEASFAGQQATFLNIRKDKSVIKATQAAWASLFEARAIFYRVNQGFDHFKVGIAVPIQKMVQSDVSGIMFSINPVNNDTNTVIIEAVWGLGETIVQGAITPDHYEVARKDWSIAKILEVKQTKEMVRKLGKTRLYSVPKSRQTKRKLSDKQIIALAKYAVKLEKHYQKPQDSEWAIEKGEIFLVQTRPITTMQAVGDTAVITQQIQAVLEKLPQLLKGEPASPGLASGAVRHIPAPKDIHLLQPGEIMVTSMTTPDFVPAMKKAGGLVTDKGGQTSHAAIVSRELGLPCVVGTVKATKLLKNGQKVTVNGQTGDIYNGEIPANMLSTLETAQSQVVNERLETKTRVYVNLAEPDLASKIADEHVDGVGLLRAEFMMAEMGHHPRALLADHREKVFIKELAAGISTFCEAFGDRPVVYRATDFKTNEYRHLKGGEEYEPEEENPLMGYRGCFRYIHDPKVFNLELEAIKKVREKHNNLWMMIPFIRSVAELEAAKSLIYKAGLRRSSTFKIWMMAEIPENVLMIDEYIKSGIDGISVGTNDLTMFMLGTDRDNENVASAYDETHPVVLWALERLVRKAKQNGVSISVCGQAPTTHHTLLEKLVEWGVTSVSVTPDAIYTAREIIAETEKQAGKKK
jgi:pyruvate,water dikinase